MKIYVRLKKSCNNSLLHREYIFRRISLWSTGAYRGENFGEFRGHDWTSILAHTSKGCTEDPRSTRILRTSDCIIKKKDKNRKRRSRVSACGSSLPMRNDSSIDRQVIYRWNRSLRSPSRTAESRSGPHRSYKTTYETRLSNVSCVFARSSSLWVPTLCNAYPFASPSRFIDRQLRLDSVGSIVLIRDGEYYKRYFVFARETKVATRAQMYSPRFHRDVNKSRLEGRRIIVYVQYHI